MIQRLFVVILFAGVCFGQSVDDSPRDYLLQQAFEPEKHVPAQNEATAFNGQYDQQEYAIAYDDIPVEAGITIQEEPPRNSRARLLAPRGRNTNRRLPNSLSRPKPQQEEPALHEPPPPAALLPQQPQEAEVVVEESPRPARRGSRFPVRNNRLRNRFSGRRKPATTAAPVVVVEEYEVEAPELPVEQPVQEEKVVIEEEPDVYYDDSPYRAELPPPTTTPKPRGLLSRRRDRSRSRSALLEALRNRRQKYRTSTASPDGAGKEKPKRFGRPRPTYIQTDRQEPQTQQEQLPEEEEAVVPIRNDAFRNRFRSRE